MCSADERNHGRRSYGRIGLRKLGYVLLAGMLLAAMAGFMPVPAEAEVILPPVPADQDRGAVTERPYVEGDGAVREQATRGGTYRSPSGGFTGTRPGTAPGGGGTYRTGPRTPSPNVTRPPTTGAGSPFGGGFGRAGSFFGGLAAGALLGHLFNPFAGFGWGWGAGYGGFGFGWSLFSLAIWAFIIYAAFRLIRRLFGGGRGGDGGRYR